MINAIPPYFSIPNLYNINVQITSYKYDNNEITLDVLLKPTFIPLKSINLYLDFPKNLGLQILNNSYNKITDLELNSQACFSFTIKLYENLYFEDWIQVVGEIYYDVELLNNFVKTNRNLNLHSLELYNAETKTELKKDTKKEASTINSIKVYYNFPIIYENDGVFLLPKFVKPKLDLILDSAENKFYFWNPSKSIKFRFQQIQNYFEEIEKILAVKNFSALENKLQDIVLLLKNAKTEGWPNENIIDQELQAQETSGAEISIAKNTIISLLEMNIKTLELIKICKSSSDLVVKSYETYIKNSFENKTSTDRIINMFLKANYGLAFIMCNKLKNAKVIFDELLKENPSWLEIIRLKRKYNL